MELNNNAAILAVRNRESLFVLYSQATRLPFVTCDEESFNDQAWFFASEEEIKEYGKALAEKKYATMGMKYEKKNFGQLYGILYAIGVNTIVWSEGEARQEIELEKLAKQADFSKLEEAKRPLVNPSLELSAIYFMQEMRRPLTMEEHQENGIRDLEEELLANLRKSEFYLPMSPDPENPKDPKKVRFPFMKDKNGKVMQPVFSDIMELQKFSQGKQLRMIKVPFVKLPGVMIPNAECFVFNPLGINLTLNKEQMEKLTK